MGEAKRRAEAAATVNGELATSGREQAANEALTAAKNELAHTLRALEADNPGMQLIAAPFATRSVPTGQDYLDAIAAMSRSMVPAPLVRFLVAPIGGTGGVLLCPFTLLPQPPKTPYPQ